MAKLIEFKFHRMDFGDSQTIAVKSCKELNEMIIKMENLTTEPEDFIQEYFNKIINEMDILREENKFIIDQWHQSCFDEIKRYKNECLANLKKEPRSQSIMIQNFKSYLELWQPKIGNFRIEQKRIFI